MNPAYLHLVLNHVSILAALFSILIFIAGMLLKNNTLKITALTGFVLAALTAVPVYLSGEEAEETVEHLPGIVENTIEAHEEIAETAIWLMEILGVFSLILLLFMRKKFQESVMLGYIVLIISLIAGGAIAYTGYAGGKIRHSEVNASSAAATVQEQQHDDD